MIQNLLFEKLFKLLFTLLSSLDFLAEKADGSMNIFSDAKKDTDFIFRLSIIGWQRLSVFFLAVSNKKKGDERAKRIVNPSPLRSFDLTSVFWRSKEFVRSRIC